MLLQIIFLFIAIILGIILLISIVAKEKFRSFLIIIALSFVILIIYALRLEERTIVEHKIYIKSLGYSIIEQKNYNEFMIYDKKNNKVLLIKFNNYSVILSEVLDKSGKPMKIDVLQIKDIE